MVKTRVIPCLLLRDLVLTKTVKFSEYYRPIGTPRQAVRVFNAREVDEMIILDIDATPQGRGPSLETIADLAEECFMPLTVGGGVRTLGDIRDVLRVGADKVAMNTEAVVRPEFVTQAAKVFGSQCVVVAIDVKTAANGQYRVMTHGGKRLTTLDPLEWAIEAEARGAGEILLTSIDRDGTMEGYDVKLVRRVADAVGIPVIACGGAGKPQDFVDVVLEGHSSAVAAASIFHFTEVTPRSIKEYMQKAGIDVRL